MQLDICYVINKNDEEHLSMGGLLLYDKNINNSQYEKYIWLFRRPEDF